MAQRPAAVASAVRREELWPRRAFRKYGRFMVISKIRPKSRPKQAQRVAQKAMQQQGVGLDAQAGL